MTARTWSFWALVRSVYDGDTLYADLDQGLGIWNRGASRNGMGLRLAGCNAIELGQPGGVEARDHLAQLVPVGSVVEVASIGWDKFAGRIDVAVTLPDGSDLVTRLIADGWAAPWDGTGPRPVPAWPRGVP